MGKWLAGIAATVIGALAIAVLTPMVVKPPPTPRIQALEGTWQFVRYAGPPPPAGPVTFRPTALSFHSDGSYSASGVVVLPGAGEIAASGAGAYTPVDAKTLKLEQKGSQPGTQVYEYAVSGDELRLTVPGTSTMIFRRA